MFGIEPLTPAFGRDYKSKKAAQADLDSGLDFRCIDGRYIDIEGLRRAGMSKIMCRSRNLRLVWLLRV